MAPKPSDPNIKSGMGCLVLFALPFASVGCFGLFMVFYTLWSWQAMKSWVEVPAHILSTELHQSRDSEGGTTYRVTATYSYEFDGYPYTSKTVTPVSGSDNIGKFHQKTYRKLKRYRDSNQATVCYVNPSNPTKAILFRDLRLGMLAMFGLFGLTFGGVGFGMIGFAIFSSRTAKQQDALKSEHSEQPWMWKEDWASGQIKSGTKTRLWFSIIFATFWNLVSSPIIFIVPQELDDGNKAVLIALLFPLVGLGLIAWAMREIWNWKKYGISTFEMMSVPGVLGGSIAGLVHTNVNLAPEHGFDIKLNCINRITTGSGKSRSTHEKVLWQDKKIIKREMLESDRTRSAIPISFQIPYDQPNSNDENSDNEIIWRLEVRAEVEGLDYKAQFAVPVFKTDDSNPDFNPEDQDLSAYEKAPDIEQLMQQEQLRSEPIANGGTRYIFPMARHLGMMFSIAIFTAFWTGGVVFLCFVSMAGDAVMAIMPMMIAFVFAMFDLIFILLMLDIWFGKTIVEVQPGQITIRGGYFAKGKTHRLTPDQIEKFHHIQNFSSGSTLYYKLMLKTTDGKDIPLGKNVKDKHLVQHLLKEMESEIRR